MEEQVLTPNDILIQQYKQFGRQHVLTHKLASWDKMVEEKIIYHPTALQSAIFAMEDLDNGVEYSTIQQGINFMCRKPNALAITQLILFEYAKKGPDFLLKTGVFTFKKDAELTKRCHQLLKDAQQENNILAYASEKE